jgi:1-phosphofructokinase
MTDAAPRIIAVILNPALDRTLEVPNLSLGGHLLGRLRTVQPAGKAVNVARVLGTLGRPCVLTGFVGRGDGDRFARSFEGLPVRVDLLEVAGPTRENVTLVDPVRHEETHIRDAGTPVTDADLERLGAKIDGLVAEAAHDSLRGGCGDPPRGALACVVFSGSLPPGMEAGRFAEILSRCRSRGARVAVDSSGPGLAAVRQAGPIWLVKPNRAELAELAGRSVATDAEVRAAAAAMREHIDTLLVSVGADGAWLFSCEGTWRARPHANPAAVVKTVGAGDALLAGYLQAYADGRSPADCLRHAVACGTAATRQLAAGQVDPADVAACVERVEVTQEE